MTTISLIALRIVRVSVAKTQARENPLPVFVAVRRSPEKPAAIK